MVVCSNLQIDDKTTQKVNARDRNNNKQNFVMSKWRAISNHRAFFEVSLIVNNDDESNYYVINARLYSSTIFLKNVTRKCYVIRTTLVINFVLSISWVCSFSLDKLYWLPRNVGYIWCNGIIHDRCIERVKKQCAKVISKVSKLSIIII